MNNFYTAIVALAVAIFWMMMLVFAAHQAHSADRFVALLEQRFAMQPGSTRVLPECGCTIRYLGTNANGRHYNVRIDRLD